MTINKVKIATPISHLFGCEAEAIQPVVRLSDCFECRDHSPAVDLGGQELFHCEIQPIHTMGDEQFRYLEKIRLEKPELKVISFHLASASQDNELKDGMFYPKSAIKSRHELKHLADVNFTKIKAIFGQSIRVLVENNNYYPTPAYQYVADPDFISEVVRENDLFFLFDVAHAQISAANMGVEYHTYISGLPLDRAIQVHVCKPQINRASISRDVHDSPDEEMWDLVKRYKDLFPIEYLTVEYYSDVNGLVKSLKKAREMVL